MSNDIPKIVEEYFNKKSNNILLDIIYDVKKQSDTYQILKYIFKNNLFKNKKLINDALYHSVYNGLYIITKVLLKYGKANPNHKHSNLEMFHYACDYYYILTAKILLEYGANIQNI